MPEKFHQYDLIKTLSKKYSHTTYLASPTNEPRHQVVLTVFPASLFIFPHERENLLQKAQRLKKLQHAHLVSILDIGIEKEQPFIVREYLPKGSLRSHLKKLSSNRLELREALTLVSQVGEVLSYAHGHNLVHGNIKPENILFDANDQIILTDFTLVSRADAIIRDQIAEEYAFCYLAPEQFAGTSDTRSDQYALGCLAYELITGRVPFAIQSLASMIGQLSNTVPAPFSESMADIPPSLETAILKTLAKDPDERFFDFSLFLEVIQAVLSPFPAFPLLRSTHFHKNRTISDPMQSTQNVSSPIHKHAAKHTTRQSLEASAASSSAEVNAAEPMNTASISQASMPEWAGIIPVPESLEAALEPDQFTFSLSEEVDPIGDGENEEEVDDWLVTDAFVRQKADAVTETTLPLTKSPDIGGSQSVRPQHKRRRVLGLAILFSVIVVAATSAFWLSRISTPDTSSHTTKKIIQAATIQTTNVPTTQPSMQATSSPTAQPSVQAMNTLVAQPSSPIPIPAVIPTPTPTPTPAISYEADAPQNTLAGGASVIGCSVCSDGKRVGYIGLNNGVMGTLQFNNVSKNIAGQYTLTIYYIIAGSDKPTTYINVNGGTTIVLNVHDTPNGDTVGTASITVSLNAGNNTIEFSNPLVPAPDMDRIVV